MGYDYDHEPDSLIATHAQALSAHEKFNIIAGIDSKHSSRIKFEKKFNRPAFANYLDAIKEFSPDLIVISTPTESHFPIFEDILKIYTPKLFLIEKPLSCFTSDTNKFINLSKKKVKIAVNYFREYEPNYLSISSQIKEGLLGFPLKIVVNYSKGILNNGSHFLKYISNFMGKYHSISITEPGREVLFNDIEPDFKLKFNNGLAYFIAHNEENFSYYNLEIVGPKGKLTLSDDGEQINHYSVIDDPLYDGYRILSDRPNIYKADMNKYQSFVYDNIYQYLKGNSEIICDENSMETTNKILEKIIESRN